MKLSILTSVLKEEPAYRDLKESVERKVAEEKAQIQSSGIPMVISSLGRDVGVCVLVVVPLPNDAIELKEQIEIWNDGHCEVMLFPEVETLAFEKQDADAITIQQRLSVLRALSQKTLNVESTNRDLPIIVIASVAALTKKTIHKGIYNAYTDTLRRGDRIDIEALLDQWRLMGYQFDTTVFDSGYVSRRGGIIDIFPIGHEAPSRIELWDNEIESIRKFDPFTQLSTQVVDVIEISPAHEVLPGLIPIELWESKISTLDMGSNGDIDGRVQKELDEILDGTKTDDFDFYSGLFCDGSLIDYFPLDSLQILSRPSEIFDAVREIDSRVDQLRVAKELRGEILKKFPSPSMDCEKLELELGRLPRRLEVSPWGATDLTSDDTHLIPFSAAPEYFGKLSGLVSDSERLTESGQRIVAVTGHSKRVHEILIEGGLESTLTDELTEMPGVGTITVLHAEGSGLNDGFVLPASEGSLVILGEVELFGISKQRRSSRRSSAAIRDAFLASIKPGDYVVHVEHGIGRFTGVGHASEDNDRELEEYLIIEYAKSDKLYVPLEHLDRVTQYLAPFDRVPNLTRLDTSEWKRTKERAERSTKELAGELLSLYASREMAEGHAFSSDNNWQIELEDSFPFEETKDQVSTLNEVKADMESKRPMDRLVCGDVGYGKTEIALRAAFKAVMDGKQVAVLVPTTVLAQQHYSTFTQRLNAYPCRVEVLSRFRTDKEQRQIIEDLNSGRIDVCIGTHRIVQGDVQFKDLGLVIVDEEQRFGVAHKERLKAMRQEVDVLTLTATPIPRTLHMSLAGVRDMSTIETPPEERLPIKTYVAEFNDELIREAILREIDRQGQVYFLHNRVYNIDYIANYIGELVPESKVSIAHGQMSEGELEGAMLEFARGEKDVLVCTTIIESGLDIPNVNTLIVNKADSFGLSQLYQLRGRVGRSSRRAYAYMLVPQAQGITETAEKRLKAMMAATELGAGFQIAMKDLEIRGAGNILGAEQSGHIHAIGFELYTRLLTNAVEELRAMAARESDEDDSHSLYPIEDETYPDTFIRIGLPSSIPDHFVDDLSSRLAIYQRLVKMESVDEVRQIGEELADRFGVLPQQTENLLFLTSLKLVARKALVQSILKENDRVVIRLTGDVGGAKTILEEILGSEYQVGNTQIRFSPEFTNNQWENGLMDGVKKLSEFMTRVSQIQVASSFRG